MYVISVKMKGTRTHVYLAQGNDGSTMFAHKKQFALQFPRRDKAIGWLARNPHLITLGFSVREIEITQRKVS